MAELVLSKEQVALIADKIDDAVKLSGWKEAIDGIVFKNVISMANMFSGKIEDELLKDYLSKLATSILEKDYITSATIAGQLIDYKVDIPKLDDAAEANLINSITSMIGAGIQMWVVKETKD